MKKLLSILGIALAAGMMFSSCTPEDGPKDEKPSQYPMKSISVNVGDETGVGVINDVDKTVNFVFNNAENFESVDIVVELNKGWTLTYPTELTGVDLQETPILNFKGPKNEIVKYNVTFSSSAFPIINPAKIQIAGLEEGAGITVDNTTKTITIAYNQETMNYNSIVLSFNEGALQANVTVPEDLDFDIADGLEQTLLLQLNGDRPYTVKFDVSAYIAWTPESKGFVDVTADYNLSAEQAAICKVYKATAISNLPVAILSNSCFDPNWSYSAPNAMWLYGGENPRDWEIHTPDGNHYDVGYTDDIFTMPGDWTGERPGMNAFGDIYMVLVDINKVNATMDSGEAGVSLSAAQGLVVTNGWSVDNTALDYLTMKSNVLDIPETKKDGEGNDVYPAAYRASIGVKDGKVSFATAAHKEGKLYTVPFQTTKPDVEALAASATTEWDVTDAAWVAGWGVRNGKSLKKDEFIFNDGYQYLSDDGVLGMGWSHSFSCVHNLVGTTYDGKLAFMINNAGYCNWDGIEGYVNVDNYYADYNSWGFNFYGYSLKQMFYLAQKFGWKDAAVLGNSYWGCTSEPVLKVNGTSLTGNTNDYTVRYTLTVNAK